MKRSCETFTEFSIAAYVVAAAVVALVLMVGHAVWREMANTPPQSSPGDEPPVAEFTDPRILVRAPAGEFHHKFRQEIAFNEQPVWFKACTFPSRSFTTRQNWAGTMINH